MNDTPDEPIPEHRVRVRLTSQDDAFEVVDRKGHKKYATDNVEDAKKEAERLNNKKRRKGRK